MPLCQELDSWQQLFIPFRWATHIWPPRASRGADNMHYFVGAHQEKAQAHIVGKRTALAFWSQHLCFNHLSLLANSTARTKEHKIPGPVRPDQETRHMSMKCPSVCQKVCPYFRTKTTHDGPPPHPHDVCYPTGQCSSASVSPHFLRSEGIPG